MARRGRRSNAVTALQEAEAYRHPDADSPLRPDVGTQPQFRKKKPPVTYRYDSSLAPALEWDGQNPARDFGEWLIQLIEAGTSLPPPHIFDRPQEFKRTDGKVVATVHSLQEAVDQLRRIGAPFLNWAGKAERVSFDVPSLPLFVHERLSTKGIIETLSGHRRNNGGQQLTLMDLFGDSQHSVTDQVLKAFEYRDKWVNRLILGDSLVVMNSLLHYEGLGEQVQMIYMDPPYGVKFGSNFQPFVRKRDVNHNDDEDLTREPEMVKAYRDTWELGLHTYLSYLRDRLLLCRELLHPSGTMFVQISDENLHHVRELMDEVFGTENFLVLITLKKLSFVDSIYLPSTADYIIAYAKDATLTKYRQLYLGKTADADGAERYDQVELPDGIRRPMTADEKEDPSLLPDGTRRYQLDNLVASEFRPDTTVPFEFEGRVFHPGPNSHWKTSIEGMKRLAEQRRLQATGGNTLRQVRFLDDFPARAIGNLWTDISGSIQSRSDPKIYVVQTSTAAIRRCILMSTDPGDLVLDPTCGSGTTAYVAEQWGRRWITIDVSRVPFALARQRLLTVAFPYYQLKDESRGPAGGFVYIRKQNNKGEEIGGIVPHNTLKSIANNEPPEEEVLVDRPEEDKKITRVTGPFTVEATIPTPVDWEADGVEDSGAVKAQEHSSFVDRMLEVLRKSPVLHLAGGKTATLENIRPPAKTLSLSAEAVVINEDKQPVALTCGPENGAISEKLVYEAAREAHAKSYTHLYVIDFAIQPNARSLIENCEAAMGIPATYVQATPDLMMGDLLKNMRSSEIFSVCGLPEVKIYRVQSQELINPVGYQVELVGLDVFDAMTMETDHRAGNDVPAWFLDTDYNGLCFHVSQAFFPRTSAWGNLKKALKGLYDDSVWAHLAGTKSAPFEAGEHREVAVKVIDDRGNELLVIKNLKEAVG